MSAPSFFSDTVIANIDERQPLYPGWGLAPPKDNAVEDTFLSCVYGSESSDYDIWLTITYVETCDAQETAAILAILWF